MPGPPGACPVAGEAGDDAAAVPVAPVMPIASAAQTSIAPQAVVALDMSLSSLVADRTPVVDYPWGAPGQTSARRGVA